MLSRCLHDALPLALQGLWVYVINIAFSALAILHLTYLGSVFNSSVDYMEEDEVRSTVTFIYIKSVLLTKPNVTNHRVL